MGGIAASPGTLRAATRCTSMSEAKYTTDFRFVVDDDSGSAVLAFDTPAERTEVYLTRGQLERLVSEADNAVSKLKCREKLSEVTANH